MREREVKVNIFDMAGHPIFYEVNINYSFFSLILTLLGHIHIYGFKEVLDQIEYH